MSADRAALLDALEERAAVHLIQMTRESAERALSEAVAALRGVLR